MATLQEVETALRNADAAGDVDAARSLAAEVVRLRGTQSDYPDIGQAGAAASGAMQGLSANWSDELLGVGAAAGLPEWARNPLEIPIGAARLGYEWLTGKPGAATDAYEQERELLRARQRAAEQQYPKTALASEIGGAVLVPAGGAARGATLGARMANGAIVGGVYGAAAGAGEGTTLEERGAGAAKGGATGAVLGGLAPPVVEGVIQGSRVVGAPVVNAVRGIVDPTGEAARRTARAIEHDVRIDPAATARLTPAEYRATPDARVIDIGGETTRSLARSSANTSAPGRFQLNETINPRYEGQSARVADWLNSNLTYPTQQAQQQAIRHVAQNVYEPRYAQAYRDSANIPLWNRDLDELAQAPEVQAAIRVALPQLRNWAVRDGLRPPTGAFRIDTSGTVPRTVLRETANGNQILPSLQLWDYVKRALDRMETPTSRQFARALRDQLDTLVPSYRTARESAQPTRFFDGASNAFEGGQNFINRGQHFGPDALRQLGRMTPEERNLFKDGYISALTERIERSPDRRNVLNQIATTAPARREIEAAIGPQRWRELEATLRIEGILDLARGAVQGNSTTARQLFELGLAGGVGGAQYLVSGDPQSIVSAMLVWGALRGQRAIGQGIDQRVAERVAQMLTSRDPRVLQRGIQLVARQNRFMDALRAVDRRIAATGGEQSPNLIGTQTPGSQGQVTALPAPRPALPAPQQAQPQP